VEDFGSGAREQKEDSGKKRIRATDAKEVGVENPAEETFCYPNEINVTFPQLFVNKVVVRRPDFCRAVNLLALRRAFFK